MMRLRVGVALGLLALAGCEDEPEVVQGPVAPRPIAATDLYLLRTATAVTVSPDGKTAVYVVQRVDSAANAYSHDLWVVATAGGSPPRRLTRLESRGMRSPVFSPAGDRVAFTASTDGVSHLWVQPMNGRDAWQLTELPGGAADPAWSPGGDTLAFTSLVDAPRRETRAGRPAVLTDAEESGQVVVVTRPDFLGETGIQPERWRHVFVVPARRRAFPRAITEGEWNHGTPAWGPDNQLVFSAHRPPDGDHGDLQRESDLFVVRPGRTSVRAIHEPGFAETDARFSPDGRYIAYLRVPIAVASPAAVLNELVVMRSDGTGRRSVSGPLDRGVQDFRFGPDGALYFTVASAGATSLYRAAADRGGARPVIGGPRGVLGFDVGQGAIAWTQTAPERPSDIHAAGLDGQGERRLTALNDALLRRLALSNLREIRYRSFDGRTVQGWLLLPASADRDRPPPLAVVIHGGPHVMGGPADAGSWLELQAMAGAGYAVFIANPRGSSGYGEAWLRAIHRDWAESPARDVLIGADTVLGRGLADPERQVVIGASYGAYLAAWIVARQAPGRFRAAVAQRGAYDLSLLWAGSNAWWVYESEFGGPPAADPLIGRDQSPITFAEQIRTPLLLQHGEADHRVPITSAEALFRSVRRAGGVVEMVRYPGQGHEMSRSGPPSLRVDHLLRGLDWMDRYRDPPVAGG